MPNIERKLEHVPEDRLIPPNPMIGGPAIEALRFAGHNDELRELFENVLATSMDTETAENAHPAFVEIIKQLSPDEARILRYFAGSDDVPIIHVRRFEGKGYTEIAKNISHLGKLAGCKNMKLVQAAIDNLCRLEICSSPYGTAFADKGLYEPLENDPDVTAIVEKEEAKDGVKIEFDRRMLSVTVFGKQFIRACVIAEPAPAGGPKHQP